MKCEDATMALQRPGSGLGAERRAAAEHLLRCNECRDAARALDALRTDHEALIHVPPGGAFERALAVATAGSANYARSAPRRPAFWLGVGVGAALAASVAVAVVMLRVPAPVTPSAPAPLAAAPAAAAPAVMLAVNERRNVSVAVSSPEPLSGAEIRIALSGDIGLQGFAEQRELQWTTDLDRGVNELTLPIVALGVRGGQVLVEVQHGDKRRAFIVDVRTANVPTAQLRDRVLHHGYTEPAGV